MEVLTSPQAGSEIRTLGELCNLRRELVEPTLVAGLRYVGLEHIDPGLPTLKRSGSIEDVRSTKSRFYAGDILYGKLRPYLDKGALAEWDGICSTDILVLQPNKQCVDPRYASFLLHTSAFLAHAVATTSGVNHPRTSWAAIAEFSHAVPRPPEQRAIAGVLAKIQAAVEVQEKIVATLKELKAATMAKLFREGLRGEPLKQTEIGDIPESWELVRCETVCEMISVGIVVTPAKYYAPVGVPCFRSFNVQEDRLLERDLVFISDAANELHGKSKLRAGDVIIVRTGYPGTACVVPKKYEGANCVDLIIARPNTQAVLSDYLSRYMNSPEGRRHVLLAQGGLAQQHFNVGAFKQMTIALPRKDEQADISRIGRLLDGNILSAEGKLSSVRSLFSSMLHLLMTGQVRMTRKMIALQALEARTKQRPKWSGKVDEKVLEEIVKRIVEAVAPEKIILFGSAARGEMGPDSDLDLLVVKACDRPREEARIIRRKLIGIAMPIDVLVETPEHLEEHKDTIGYIYRPALREGKVIYERKDSLPLGLPESVERFVSGIAQRFTPERIILFGSYADGTATRESDVDLLVVMRFEGRARDQAARIDGELERSFPLDLLVRRPEDVERALEMGDPFMTEIVQKGEVLYARPE